MEFGPKPKVDSVSPLSPSNHFVIIFGIWQNLHIDSLACAIKIIKVGKKNQVEDPETPHSHLWPT